ncbi:Hypothetical protein R9X50_00694800 [Acrodontium crateriforme]|uniref:DNA-directed RNA polymerase III subunit RPC3 n=1 Tax=Acrodontium crateriforme TaxID=150365 RepID=A0AAQ3RAD6_9PEZI|nr:Hypothetical protein R9X50_00694800 [Acrodontium crateriforme]
MLCLAPASSCACPLTLLEQIFSTLAEYGRLTLQTLAQHMGVAPRRLRHAIGLLLEQQLVLRYAPEDGSPGFYSVDWRNAYGIVRQDNIIDLVKDRHGEGAGKLVGNILQLGSACVGDLVRAVENTKAPNHISETNGNSHEPSHPSYFADITTVSQVHAALRVLLRSGLVVKVTSRSYVAPTDLQEELEDIVKNAQFPDGKISGPKKQAEFKAAVNNLKRQWREADSYSDAKDLASRGSGVGPNKRLKLNGALTNGHAYGAESDDSGPRLSNELIVRVNHSRCALALRSQRLQQLAKRVLGPVTAAVYGALLRALESKCRNVRDDEIYETEEDEEAAQPIANVGEVAEILDPTIDLTSSIKGLGADENLANGAGKKRKKDRDDYADIGIKREDQSDSDGDQRSRGLTSYRDRSKRLTHIQAHLCILEEHFYTFCSRVRAHGGQNEWRVNFPTVTQKVILAELDTTISARFGKVSLRIVRMLREKGRLDEKQLSSRVMMRIKEVRSILTQLQFHGYMEAQELPKDNSRQPSRTIFLWFIDDARIQSSILQQTYKAMTRTIQRIEFERKEFQPVIAKADRSDVKNQEQNKLEMAEKQMLRDWREREERLWSQVSRMDDIVALLRDFSKKDVSLLS